MNTDVTNGDLFARLQHAKESKKVPNFVGPVAMEYLLLFYADFINPEDIRAAIQRFMDGFKRKWSHSHRTVARFRDQHKNWLSLIHI